MIVNKIGKMFYAFDLLSILTDSDLFELFPIWSPNGEYIAFMSTDYESWNLEVMNANGEERKILASWVDEE